MQLEKYGRKRLNNVYFISNNRINCTCNYTYIISLRYQKENFQKYVFCKCFWYNTFIYRLIQKLRYRKSKKSYPILVESIYYGEHYQVIIGYDRRSKNGFLNDILIFADSSDETDDYIDGYTYFSAYKFFKMWFDDRFLPVEHRQQPYAIVKGKR